MPEVMEPSIAKLKAIIHEIAHTPEPSDAIADSANLFDDCGMDSTSIVDLVLAIESQFEIEINEDELDASLFATVSTLSSFIDLKRTRSASEHARSFSS